MKQIQNLHEIKEIINTGKPVLLYFWGPNCPVCHDLKPKILESFRTNLPKIELCEINTNEHKELTSHFTVFSLPTILVFFEKKEFKRIGKNISVALFTEDIKRVYEIYYGE